MVPGTVVLGDVVTALYVYQFQLNVSPASVGDQAHQAGAEEQDASEASEDQLQEITKSSSFRCSCIECPRFCW